MTAAGSAPQDHRSGVIHDIGYRHHDGPRLGRGYVWRSLFGDSARGSFGLGRTTKSKVVPMLLLVAACLPALVVVVIAGVTSTSSLLLGYEGYVYSIQLLVVIFVAGQAPASVSRDLRFHVTSLYFSRPLTRRDYVLAKYAGLSTGVLVLTVLPLLILVIGSLLVGMRWQDQVPDFLRGLAGAVLVALVVSGIALVIAAITPRRGLGVAAIVTVLLVAGGLQGTSSAIASSQGQDTAAWWLGLLGPFSLVETVQDDLLAGFGGTLGSAGGPIALVLTLAVIVGCFGLLMLRYRRVGVS